VNGGIWVCLETGIEGRDLIDLGHAHAAFGVFPKASLKYVCFPLEAYCFHPFKWVACFEVLMVSKGTNEAVGAKLMWSNIICEVIPISSTMFSILGSTALMMILMTHTLTLGRIFARQSRSRC
jgi:hypothetical protein